MANSPMLESLEAPASFAACNAPDELKGDAAFGLLQPPEAALQLIEERNSLRARLRRLEEEVESQRKLTQLYATHLQELISRVRSLGKATADRMLAGLQLPCRESISLVLSQLLSDVREVHCEEASETSSILPLIDSYLDKALTRAQNCVPLYSQLELTNAPVISEPWKTIEERLAVSRDSTKSILLAICQKAEALSAMKCVEAASLNEAVHRSQVLKSMLEDMVIESEGWAVCEALHGRADLTKLQQRIQKRLALMSQPLTLELVEELLRLFAKYKSMREAAAPRPWTHAKGEGEWWQVVSLCSRLAFASEATLQKIAVRPTSDLSALVGRLRREVGVDSEGMLSFVTAVLEQLIKTERLKAVHLEVAPNLPEARALRKAVKELSTENLNLALVLATDAGQPLQHWLRLKREVESADSDILLAASGVITAVRKLQKSPRSEEPADLDWTVPLLERSLDAAERDRDEQAAETLRRVIRLIQDEKQHSGDHRRAVAACLHLALARLSRDPAGSRLEVSAADTAKELQLSCAELSTTEHSEVKTWADDFASRVAASGSLSEKVKIVGEAIATFLPLLKQDKREFQQNGTSNPPLDAELRAALTAAAAFLQASGKLTLLQECRRQLDSKSSVGKLRFLCSVFDQSKSVTNLLPSKGAAEKLKSLCKMLLQNSERLANDLRSEEQQRTRQSISALRTRMNAPSAESLAEVAMDALLVERRVADLVALQGFQAVDTAEGVAPVDPVRKPSASSVALASLTEGLTHLFREMSLLCSDLRVRLDELQHSQRLQAIAQASGEQQTLLQEEMLHWQLCAVQTSVAATHRRLLEKTIASLEQIATLKHTSRLEATIKGLKEDSAALRRPLLRLLEEAQDAVNQELPALSGGAFASEEIWTAIQEVVRIYETELHANSVQVSISRQEEANVTSSDPRIRAKGFLRLLGAGAKALSEKTKRLAQLQDSEQTAIAETSATLTATLETLGVTEAATEEVASWRDAGKAAAAVKSAVDSLFAQLAHCSSTQRLPDVQSRVRFLLSGSASQPSTRTPRDCRFLLSAFQAGKQNLVSAADLLQDEATKQRTTATLASLTSRAEGGEALDALESVLAALAGVLQALHAKGEAKSPGLESQLRMTRKIAAALGTRLDSCTEDQVARSEKAEGASKLVLQQSALQSALAFLHAFLLSSCQTLTCSLLSHARRLGTLDGMGSELEEMLAGVERNASECGASFSLVLSADEMLSCLIGDFAQAAN